MGTWKGTELDDVVLSDSRLTLRAFTLADAPTVHEAFQAPAMHEFLAVPVPYTPADAYEYIEKLAIGGRADGHALECALVEIRSGLIGSRHTASERMAGGRIVGAASLRLPAARRTEAEIGYAVYPWGQGHGYAARATRLLCDWAFAHEVSRVELRAALGNLASIRTALNAGFQFEGIARAGVMGPEGALDGAVFGRTAINSGAALAPAFADLPARGLTDGVIALRIMLADDTDACFDERTDNEALRWRLHDAAVTLDEVRLECERAALDWWIGREGVLAIVDVASGQTTGTLRLRQAGPPGVAGIGYGMRPSWRGRGYTARALQLVREWALRELSAGGGGFNRLELGAKAANLASQKVAIAGGFEADGVRTGRLRNPGGSFSDEVRFAAVRRP